MQRGGSQRVTSHDVEHAHGCCRRALDKCEPIKPATRDRDVRIAQLGPVIYRLSSGNRRFEDMAAQSTCKPLSKGASRRGKSLAIAAESQLLAMRPCAGAG